MPDRDGMEAFSIASGVLAILPPPCKKSADLSNLEQRDKIEVTEYQFSF